ncbi:diguanylate cyclase (GGDEF) domain-containing protein [Sphingomonas laterariae]|uniref:diguanylate cyclase n=1 Tax=Edaphosphingomonas laterariae TaxID=861865 RepID=A0A239G7R6_9SPHN|nr:GGDEF domain-containing protein [Sphingomonas laterariae]SNS65386.1 diguanylate cyclase (GGDEF) domain-containing protein [Sphingomonas laterariae]
MRLRTIIAMVLVLCGFAAAAKAAPTVLHINQPLCHIVTPGGRATPPPADQFRCHGEPAGYQSGSLWLRADLSKAQPITDGLALLTHQTRFSRMVVAFDYADGTRRIAEVRQGAFGSHWRIGGQIAFEAPARDSPLTAMTIGFDRLASHSLLRMRLMTTPTAATQSSIIAAIVGGALTLLLLGALYNLALAHAVRRQFIAWHGAWAASVLIWGLLWSQLALLAVPQVAGALASQICTFLSTLAIGCATASAITSLERGLLPRGVRIGVLALGGSIALIGIPTAMIRSAAIDMIAPLLGLLILADLVAVAACIIWAWRQGSSEARDFALAWAPPMATLALTQLVDIDDQLFGGGSQVAVLIASALQTAWLSVAITRRLARLRAERDNARAAQRELDELARRDSLTGLLNRRGFIAAANDALAEAAAEGSAFGLLLIDVDHFKSINDRFGHDVGDAVLKRIAERLRQWEGDICTAGRLGGEEFILAMRGLGSRSLAEFADCVRTGISGHSYRDILPEGAGVTVSIGTADSRGGDNFHRLYKIADEALYEAKRTGRDRVVSGNVDAAKTITAMASRRA